VKRRILLSLCLLGALVSYGGACGDEDLELTDDPTLDLWCGSKLCESWGSSGAIRRVGTWHEADYAVELASKNASIWQHIERNDERFQCVDVTLFGDWTLDSKLVLELDWNDDGTADWSEPLSAQHWQRWTITPSAQAWFSRFKVTLRREGNASAVIAEVRVRRVDSCTTGPAPIDEDASIDDDAGAP
jgi:hypothetical protein